MFANNNICQIRSSGIADSCYGYVVTSIWLGKDRFKRSPYLREPLPLPASVSCYTVAATTSGEYNESSPKRDALVSDGLGAGAQHLWLAR